jgi:hypothetical protein
MVLINSNKDLSLNREAREHFESSVEKVLADTYYFLRVQTPTERAPGALGEANLPHPELIDEIEWKIGWEEGPLKHRTHGHAIIRIAHHTRVLIDQPAMQEAISELVGYQIRLSAKGRADVAREIEEYSQKEGRLTAPQKGKIPGK